MNQIEADRAGTAEFVANGVVAEEESEASIDLMMIFQKLVRNRKTIFVITVIVFTLVTIVAFLLPFQYTSTLSLIPPSISGGNSTAAVLAGQLSAMGAGDLLGSVKNPGELYAGILTSRSIARTLVARFDLKRLYKVKNESQAEKILASSTAVVIDAKSTIVTLSVTDKNPLLAQKIANAYVDALRETNGRLALSQSSQRRLFFGQQLAKEKDDLEDAEVELKRTEEQSGLIAPNGQTESEIRTIAETQAQMAIRQVQLAALHQSATDQNPDVVRLKSEIEDLQGQLSRLQRGTGNGTAAIPTSKVPALQLDYIRKEREVKYHEALFDALSRQFEAARMDEARDSPMVQVLDEASYPDTKTSPKRSYFMAAGLVFGFFAGIIWVLSRDLVQSLRSSLMTRDPITVRPS